MKKLCGIIMVGALLLSCGKRGLKMDFDNPDWSEEGWGYNVEVKRDSGAPGIPQAADESEKSMGASTYSHSSTTDNMRGFDPASEDDMDDNGMSRYMENNDEEGWE